MNKIYNELQQIDELHANFNPTPESTKRKKELEILVRIVDRFHSPDTWSKKVQGYIEISATDILEDAIYEIDHQFDNMDATDFEDAQGGSYSWLDGVIEDFASGEEVFDTYEDAYAVAQVVFYMDEEDYKEYKSL